MAKSTRKDRGRQRAGGGRRIPKRRTAPAHKKSRFESGKPLGHGDVLAPLKRRMGVSDANRAAFYKKVARMIANGKMLHAVLNTMLQREVENSGATAIAFMIEHVIARMNSGDSFGNAISKYASNNEVMLLKAGDQSGKLADAMNMAEYMLRTNAQITRTVRGALLGPFFQIVMVIVSVMAVCGYLVPKLTGIFPPSQWHGVPYTMYLVFEFVQSAWLYFFILFFLAVAGWLWWSIRNWNNPLRVKFDRFPPWSLYRLMVGTGWMLSLVSMLEAGLKQVDAVKQMRDDAADNGNKYLMYRLDEAHRYMQEGKSNLGDALANAGHDFPDAELVADLQTYSDLPNFDEVLRKEAMEWVREGVDRVEAQAKVARLAGTVAMGLMSVWFTAAVMLLQQQMSTYFLGMAG